jgi:hypothetical protein
LSSSIVFFLYVHFDCRHLQVGAVINLLTVTTPDGSNAEIVRASRSNRAFRSGSEQRCEGCTFTATSGPDACPGRGTLPPSLPRPAATRSHTAPALCQRRVPSVRDIIARARQPEFLQHRWCKMAIARRNRSNEHYCCYRQHCSFRCGQL